MAITQATRGIFQELADLFAACPSREQMLEFRPSKALQRRARVLLTKQGQERLSDDEERELDEFRQAEFFMGLLKAKLHAQKAS